MSITEYLYVDEERLNSYFEQISSPVKYDKVPVWKASFSLTGPNAEGQQARFSRPFTQHEKIAALTQYIKTNKQSQAKFFPVTCQMTRVVIPPRVLETDFKGLVLWIADSTYDLGKMNTLCLLQDNRTDDDDDGVLYDTAYSALSVFLYDMRNQVKQSILSQHMANVDLHGSEVDADFHKNPLVFLKQIGARSYAKRTVRTVYRKRTTSGKMAGDSQDVVPHYQVTIGYPIWITDVADCIQT